MSEGIEDAATDYVVKPLDATTWDAFARLVDADGSSAVRSIDSTAATCGHRLARDERRNAEPDGIDK